MIISTFFSVLPEIPASLPDLSGPHLHSRHRRALHRSHAIACREHPHPFFAHHRDLQMGQDQVVVGCMFVGISGICLQRSTAGNAAICPKYIPFVVFG